MGKTCNNKPYAIWKYSTETALKCLLDFQSKVKSGEISTRLDTFWGTSFLNEMRLTSDIVWLKAQLRHAECARKHRGKE